MYDIRYPPTYWYTWPSEESAHVDGFKSRLSITKYHLYLGND